MTYRIGELVKHKHALFLARGEVVEIQEKHPNPDHDKKGPWYYVAWDAFGGATGDRPFHGDALRPYEPEPT